MVYLVHPIFRLTILDKIEHSDVFVCDVTIINNNDHNIRPTPNPNVLLGTWVCAKGLRTNANHFGYEHCIWWPELLPFDLRMKQVITYNMAIQAEERVTERKKLSSTIEAGISSIIDDIKNKKVKQSQKMDWDIEWLNQHRSAANSGIQKLGLVGFRKSTSLYPLAKFT